MKLDNVLKGSYQRYIAADFLSTAFFNKRIPLIVDGIDRSNIDAVKNKLTSVYGDVRVTFESGESEGECSVAELSCEKEIDVIIVDEVELIKCERFDFSDFVQIMKRLRAKDGCEWDRAQTHESIRINLIEEAYELVEAIDKKDAAMMREECGDVLMQAIFHTEIASERDEFDYYDMFTELCRKLIDRHTHIFGSNHARNAEEALVFWNEAKKKEKKYTSTTDAMDRVPKNLPSLLYAEKIQKRARKAGFDWEDAQGAWDKVREELVELEEADDEHRFEEAGDLLFAIVNLLRFYKIDPEMALHGASAKFCRRFAAVELAVKNSGREMTDCSLDELDAIWNEVKLKEKDGE